MNEIREIVASELAHIAAKMPYAAESDARQTWGYLVERFGFPALIVETGMTGPNTLLERAIEVRAAAERVATQ